MRKERIGVWLAVIALLVNVPRFVLVFLRVDGINLPLEVEGVMLGASGIATGLVLTGGGAYIAHRLAESNIRGIVRIFLVVCWLSLLVFSVILLAPLLVSAIRTSSLNTVFGSSFSQWLWAVVAVSAVEILAAGAVAATSVREEETTKVEENSLLAILSRAIIRRIAHQILPHDDNDDQKTGNSSTGQPKIVSISTNPVIEQIVKVEGRNGNQQANKPSHLQQSKVIRREKLLELIRPLEQEKEIQIDVLADQLGCSRQTIYRDISELKKSGQLQIDNGKIVIPQISN